MSFVYKCKLPTAEEILNKYPLPRDLQDVKSQRDREIKNVFTGRDNRLLVIIGPCSAHNEDAVSEYVSRLSKLQEKVCDRLILVPRIYTNKPRTTGQGYKGMLHQPDHQKDTDIVAGLEAIRHMHLRVLSESKLPAADEMLYPTNSPIWRIFSPMWPSEPAPLRTRPTGSR
jgi:3-deoxy-7-phosphoheptulonate synthase